MLRTPLVRIARALPLDAVPARSRPLDCRRSCRPANRPCRPRWHAAAGTTLGAMQGGAAKFKTVDEYAELEHGSSMAPTSTSDDAAFGSESLNRAMFFALATAPSLVALAVRCLASSLPAPASASSTTTLRHGRKLAAGRPLLPAATSTRRQEPRCAIPRVYRWGIPGSARGLAARKLEAGVRCPLPGPAKGPSAVGAHQPPRCCHYRSAASDVKPGNARPPFLRAAKGPFRPPPTNTRRLIELTDFETGPSGDRPRSNLKGKYYIFGDKRQINAQK